MVIDSNYSLYTNIMEMKFWKKKPKVWELPKFVYALKKCTNFGYEIWYFALVKEDSVFSKWNVLFKVNNREILTLEYSRLTNSYACETKEEALELIETYKKQLLKENKDLLHRDEIIELETIKK